jgi:5-methylcytosine-specific restriction protein A
MPDRDRWTDEELRASVEAYIAMLEKSRSGRDFTKKQYYRDLAQRFDRTEKSFEWRMQNISHVFSLLGRDWLPGARPARNVGATVVSRIEQMIADIEGGASTGQAEFQEKVQEARKKRRRDKPAGNRKPRRTTASREVYDRDPEVAAWVLNEAKGHCESCAGAAPFDDGDGLPFLEVHHVRRLADGGSDRVENAVALCPNCHRALHYASDRVERRDRLYAKAARLERE